MKTIHVAYALDDNYAEITCVSMASMLYNTKNPIHFYVIESRLSEGNKKSLSSLKNRFPHGEWTFYTIDELNKSDLIIGSGHVTYEAYLRLFLPEILPHLDKVIYIDGDTVVESDIAELWNIELGDKYLGAVPSLTIHGLPKKRWLGISEDGNYYASGLLLLDLHKLREFELAKKAVKATSQLYQVFQSNKLAWYEDQEVLNYLVNSKCKALPAKFSFHHMYSSMPNFDIGTLEDWREAFMNPAILHYMGMRKPDKLTRIVMQHPMWERYYIYKVMTPFADAQRDKIRIKKYLLHESKIDEALIHDPINYIEYKRHKLFEQLAVSLPDMLQGKKLALWGKSIDAGYIMAMLATKNIYADIFIDGLAENHGKSQFHYVVQSPEILKGRGGEFFVLLCMRNEKPASSVIKVLEEYGYKKTAYHHVFAPLWDIINEDIYNTEI